MFSRDSSFIPDNPSRPGAQVNAFEKISGYRCIISSHSVNNSRIQGGNLVSVYQQEESVLKKKLIIMALLAVFWAGTAGAQLIPDPDVQVKINDARQAITLTGKISHADSLGGYFLDAGAAGHKVILNQNYQTFKELAQKRRRVKIQGRTSPFDLKARYLFIEKIDGKPYHGDKAPLVKPPTKITPWF
jgi:hypothetical protein